MIHHIPISSYTRRDHSHLRCPQIIMACPSIWLSILEPALEIWIALCPVPICSTFRLHFPILGATAAPAAAAPSGTWMFPMHGKYRDSASYCSSDHSPSCSYKKAGKWLRNRTTRIKKSREKMERRRLKKQGHYQSFWTKGAAAGRRSDSKLLVQVWYPHLNL